MTAREAVLDVATRYFLGIAEPGANNWSISFPAFPGTVTTGDTFADLMTNARDALASVVAAMEEEGQPIPEGYDGRPEAQPAFDAADYQDPRFVVTPVDVGGRAVRINVTMDEGIVARLDNLAERLSSSRSALLARGARIILTSEAAE